MTTTYINRRQTTDGAWFVTEIADDSLPGVPVHLLSENDQTAGLPTPYDPRCTMCWLGHAHSQLLHKASIADHIVRASL